MKGIVFHTVRSFLKSTKLVKSQHPSVAIASGPAPLLTLASAASWDAVWRCTVEAFVRVNSHAQPSAEVGTEKKSHSE